MQQTGEDRRLAEEILGHADVLWDTPLTGEQRERLQRIRQAANRLLAWHDNQDSPPKKPCTELPDTLPTSQKTIKKTANILLVEDNPFTQKLIVKILSQQGYQVTLAQNGQEALDHLEQTSFDLTLMDLRMPIMDGFQTTTAIRNQEKQHHTRRMPIIAVTALVGETERKQAMEVGMDGFHAKPVRATMLFEEMDRLLDHRPSPVCHPDPEPTDALQIIDLSRLLKTVDGDLELLKEITDLYFLDAPRQMARMQRALIAKEPAEIREAAHSLKGATGAFGQNAVYHLALALEQAGQAKNLQQAELLWNQLTSALHTMETVIKQAILAQVGESS